MQENPTEGAEEPSEELPEEPVETEELAEELPEELPPEPREKPTRAKKPPRDEFVRAEKWMKNNKLARVLLKRSRLDEKTLRAAVLHASSEDASFEEIAERLRMQKSGAWKRWKRGRDEVLRSFNTILLAVYAQLIPLEAAEFLVDQLTDYIAFSRGGEDRAEVRDRIEKRMAQMRRRGIL